MEYNNNIVWLPKSILIKEAIALAKLAGNEHLDQGLAMAEILAQAHLDDTSIAAAIVLSSAQHDLELEDIKEHLGPEVSSLVQHTQQLANISELYAAVAHYEPQHYKIDNIRKMLLVMVNDIRAVLIKLAERLYILRNIKYSEDEIKQPIAKEISNIYAPLANRLGLTNIKWELEDLAFRFLQPQKYQKIAKAVNARRADRDKYIKKFITKLEQDLAKLEIKNLTISGRAKHIYSIYRKMQRKKIDFAKVYDALAIRILTNNIEDCYKVLSHIHATFKPINQEFDDYIAAPKDNGYKSIHTAIIGPNKKNIEIQIRTQKMHEEAELGMAAHWIYKEGAQKNNYENKIAWLRQIMDWQQEVSLKQTKLQEINKIFEDRIYVFTPADEVIDLPKGATPLDFAYYIHSEIGHRCRGAKINNKIVNLTYKLKTGDKITIITAKQGHPSRDWLNSNLGYLITPRAKAKVHQWFNKQNYQHNIDAGQELLDKEFKKLNFKNINITNIADELNYKDNDTLLAAIGTGELKISAVINVIQKETLKSEPPTFASPKTTSKTSANIEIHGIRNLLTRIANCCKPLPGEPIIGYVTQGRGISIHRFNCPNISAKRTKKHKLIDVSWQQEITNHYSIDMVIIAHDRPGLLKDITSILASEKTNLLDLTCDVDKKKHLTHISLTIEINNLAALNIILSKLAQLPNVITVHRV